MIFKKNILVNDIKNEEIFIIFLDKIFKEFYYNFDFFVIICSNHFK